MDTSEYAFVQGIRRTRGALTAWNRRPWPVLGAWLVGAVAAAGTLLLAVWLIGQLSLGPGAVSLHRPPFEVGRPVLLICAIWEVYGAPHLLAGLILAR